VFYLPMLADAHRHVQTAEVKTHKVFNSYPTPADVRQQNGPEQSSGAFFLFGHVAVARIERSEIRNSLPRICFARSGLQASN
jgi:hypothetical protein